MQTRKFVIPTVSALSMGMTAACTDPIVGDWSLSNYAYGTYSTDYPYTYTYGTTELIIEINMTIDSDGLGTFQQLYTYTVDAGTPEVYDYSYGLTATETTSKQYTIDIGEGGLVLDCGLDGKVLTCTDGDPAEPATLTWNKQ